MGERLGQQLLQAANALVKVVVEPARLVLTGLVEAAFLLALKGALLGR